MERDLMYKIFESNGYSCNCVCIVHQILNLKIKGKIIPNLKEGKRIGVIKKLSVFDRKTENKSIERVETEITVFDKYWYESLGQGGDLIVILEESKKIFNSVEEIENNLEGIVKFVNGKEDRYNREIISLGIKSLFEKGEISYWNKTVYFLYDVNSTGKSAGVPLLLAFYSAFFRTGIPSGLSATGEIDEEGNIKKIGGLKQKFLWALWNKETNGLILPQENYEKVQKISDDYYKRYSNTPKKNFKFCQVSNWKDLITLLFEWK
jgi:predicted ATP-dependent protease